MRAQKVRNSSRVLSTSVDKASATCWTSCELTPTALGLEVCFTQHLASVGRVLIVDQLSLIHISEPTRLDVI
eukprot:5866770-Prorocentrum_lima.AAC.1